jgi:hypothetical protein
MPGIKSGVGAELMPGINTALKPVLMPGIKTGCLVHFNARH